MALSAADGIVTIKSCCKWHMCGPSTFLSINSSFLIKISSKRLTPHIPKYKNIEGNCMYKRGRGGVPFVLRFGGSISIESFCLIWCQKCWPLGLCCFMGNLSIFEALYWYSFQHEAKDFLRSLWYSLLELSSFLYQLGNVVCWKDGASRQKWFQLYSEEWLADWKHLPHLHVYWYSRYCIAVVTQFICRGPQC